MLGVSLHSCLRVGLVLDFRDCEKVVNPVGIVGSKQQLNKNNGFIKMLNIISVKIYKYRKLSVIN